LKIQEINSYLVLFHNGRVLLLKRPNGLWEFPGGGVDWGETPENAALREAKEETSLLPNNVSFLTVTSATYKQGEDDKHSIYFVYKGDASNDKVILSSEHVEYRWLTVHEAKYMKMALNAEPVLELI